MKHEYMPISIAMKGRKCLVVGGGKIALRKVENLIDYSADVTVVAKRVHDQLKRHAQRGTIAVEEREYRPPEAANYGLVFSATDDHELNQRVHDDARSRGVLVNVIDDPPRCDFIAPAVLRRDCLAVAITTDGKAPFMAGRLRVILNELFPEHWERLMKLAASFRVRVRNRWPHEPEEKKRCYAEFFDADWKEMFADLDDDEIEKQLTAILEHQTTTEVRR